MDRRPPPRHHPRGHLPLPPRNSCLTIRRTHRGCNHYCPNPPAHLIAGATQRPLGCATDSQSADRKWPAYRRLKSGWPRRLGHITMRAPCKRYTHSQICRCQRSCRMSCVPTAHIHASYCIWKPVARTLGKSFHPQICPSSGSITPDLVYGPRRNPFVQQAHGFRRVLTAMRSCRFGCAVSSDELPSIFVVMSAVVVASWTRDCVQVPTWSSKFVGSLTL